MPPTICTDSAPAQSPREEFFNAVTHGLGMVLSVIGLIALMLATRGSNPWLITACAVYGSTLVLLYGVSMFYHCWRHPRLKRLFQILDHCCIFLLIAGTYTPFTLTVLRGPWGWTLFGLVWGIALLGIVFKIFCTGRYDGLSTAAYLLMGWIVVIAVVPLFNALPMPAILWLIAGGLFYTAGVYFYRLDYRRYFHAIWHCFVLAGSACQFAAVLLYLVH